MSFVPVHPLLRAPLAGVAARAALVRAVSGPGLAGGARSSSSESPSKHAPSLADVRPDNHADFNERQRVFRQDLHAAQKLKSAAAAAAVAASSGPSETGVVVDNPALHGLGSLSTATGAAGGDSAAVAAAAGAAKDARTKSAASRLTGPLNNLLYGTKEGREMDAQIEASFSAVLARGKYMHSIVFHTVKPDCVQEYIDLVGTWYPRMAAMPENKVHLVGSWRTEVGDCDTFVHIWEYQRYQGYHASLNSISSHPDFPEFNRNLRKLITARHSSLMQEFSFWPTTPPRKLGGLFELRSYELHPGHLLEWESHWRRGLTARREVMEGVGAWFVQIGDLNTVHHLWQFANLEERKQRREKSWSIDGWADTVHRTVPLIQTMKSRILIAMPWSPVA